MADTINPVSTEGLVPERGTQGAARYACLIVAFDATLPLDLPSRHWLVNLDEVSLGRRVEGRSSSRVEGRGNRRLRLGMPGKSVSAEHTHFYRDGARWVVVDGDGQGKPSRNRTYLGRDARPDLRQPDLRQPRWLNWVAVSTTESTVLCDGDLIQAGPTFLVFREISLEDPPAPLDSSADSREIRFLPEGFRTMSPELEHRLARAATMAQSRHPMVTLGDPGTGKELFARAVHACSKRKGELVVVDCGAIAKGIIESELFGHKKGAFSDADSDRQGLVETARDGTLFLDELGDLPLELHQKLLRLIQECEIRPAGSDKVRKVDVRVVAATHKDVPEMVEKGDFRKDLWSRLDGFNVKLPRLEARKEDLGLLLSTLLARHTADAKLWSMTVEAAAAMFAYNWPNNIRELDKKIGVATIQAGSDRVIETRHFLPDAEAKPAAPAPESVDKKLIALLRMHKGRIRAVAAAWKKGGVSESFIRQLCKDWKIDFRLFRDSKGHSAGDSEGDPEDD